MDTLTEDQRDYVQTILRSGKDLLALISDILDYSKMDAGRIALESIPCSPSHLAHDVFAQHGAQAQAKKLDLQIKCSSAVPSTVLSDPTRIKQLLHNLLANAIKFTPAGSVHLTLDASPHEHSSKVWLQMAVRDTGIGISPAQREKLFLPFSQADTSTTREYGGTGLGLAICKKICKALGGDISLDSALGEGSLFTARIPVEPAHHPHTPFSEVADQRDTLSGISVLVVEDDIINQKAIENYLLRCGAQTIVASNGMEAIELFQKRKPAIILMDVQMPVMDGLTSCRQIRVTEMQRGLPKCPVIGITADALPGDHQRCLDAGMDDYMAKPIEFDELKTKIARWAKSSR